MKVYRHGNAFIAPKGSFFDGHVRIDGDFIVSAETHFWGKLDVDGTLELGPGSTVGGAVSCNNAVIGKGCRIKGPLIVLENATICDDVILHSVRANGNIVLRPGVKVGDVYSDETIFVYGKISSGTLTGRNVKVVGN
jgi:cytoskeletal protein CcmA (bactofilin family)